MSQTTSKVLILLSTYNGECYLEQQLESILHQSYNNIDIIVRDDGSTDSTLSILSFYEKRYKNITVIAGNNIGCAQSFWQLIIYANEHKDCYSFYAFCDQDDIWMEDKIAIAVNLLETTNSLEPFMYCSNLIVVDSALHPIGLMRKDIPNTSNKAKSLMESFATGCTMVFNNKLLQLSALYSGQNLIMHDLWLFHICMFFGKIYYDQQAHILYRQHDNNKIGSKTTRIQKLQSKLKSLKTLHSQHFRELETRELLFTYRHMVSPKDRAILEFVATYRIHWLLRIKWFLGISPISKALKMTKPLDNFFLKLRIILGKV